MIDRERILHYHRKAHGKTEMISRVLIEGKEDLSTYYTPGVSVVSDEIGIRLCNRVVGLRSAVVLFRYLRSMYYG